MGAACTRRGAPPEVNTSLATFRRTIDMATSRALDVSTIDAGIDHAKQVGRFLRDKVNLWHVRTLGRFVFLLPAFLLFHVRVWPRLSHLTRNAGMATRCSSTPELWTCFPEWHKQATMDLVI